LFQYNTYVGQQHAVGLLIALSSRATRTHYVPAHSGPAQIVSYRAHFELARLAFFYGRKTALVEPISNNIRQLRKRFREISKPAAFIFVKIT